ncbi:unnamed protein product [Orchesella dallaii]|uniref:Oxygen-dependent choline dehydrogenase n=1 Tax=Orchesella dallaii TaxID=48710 RepID=A0ABP1RLQ7_9HEXA
MKLLAFVLGSIPILIQFYAKKGLEEDRASTLTELEGDLNLPNIREYDFIVVGGGSAGCVLAGRISEHFNVLLLEGGGEPVPATQVPYFAYEVGFNPSINYAYRSVPQPRASNRVISLSLGKMLGGSGSHNDMAHTRGSPFDYNNYAHLLNDTSWTYSNVLKYFKLNEDFIGQLFEDKHWEYYGHNGPITVDTDTPPFLPIWFEVAKELGYEIGDPNGYQRESFAPLAKAIKKGQRSSSYNEYVKPFVGTRKNLTVHPYSIVTQVLIDGNKKAYGVLYERHGIPQIAHASKEIIISSGVFGSPLLLMKSGIGPRDQLEAARIPVKLELPSVGQNLEDHLMFTLSNIQYNSSILPFISQLPKDEKEFQEALKTYQETGEGLLGQLIFGPQAFLVSSRAKQELQWDWPDLQLFFSPDNCLGVNSGGNDIPISCIHMFLTRGKSRGSVQLNRTVYRSGVTNDDTKLAVIDYKMFEGEGESDLDVLIEGTEFLLTLINSTTMKKYGARWNGRPHPACKSFEFPSKDYWRCLIPRQIFVAHHGVGTCSMGCVVDSKFRVKGISNLRVVDASVFPAAPNANINAAVMMIAEKASDDVRMQWM